jgi:hypothetical protein
MDGSSQASQVSLLAFFYFLFFIIGHIPADAYTDAYEVKYLVLAVKIIIKIK